MNDRNNMTVENKKIVTRFAPSPTGMFHVGGIRSALYNYLYARQHRGTFILRCEDTDPTRSKKEYEDYFLEVFRWLGLEHDEYYRQSERTEIYKNYLERLISEGKAYISNEEPKEEGQRASVIRFKNPNKVVKFHDMVLGDISVDTTDLGDFVIARSIESPVYHFTVVVDDFEMGVTHIIRGQEHVSNTPRQILIQEAIGAERPVYAHASIILNEERAKLSKRDPLVRPSLEYRDDGYLPEAMLNFMALLGWNPGTEKEVFTLPELIDAFSMERMQKPGAVFNPEKLEWMNREHIKRLDENVRASFVEKYLPESTKCLSGYSQAMLRRITPILIERLGHFGEIRTLAEAGDISYFFELPVYEKDKLLWKGETDTVKLIERLRKVRDIIAIADENDFTKERLKEILWGYAEEEGRGQVLWPTRFALSGKEKSPDPFQLAEIFGKHETIRRIDHAISLYAQ